MSVEKIKDIANLIQLEPGKKITGQKVQHLTAPGENYGSVMLSLDITVNTPKGTEEVHAVAKMVPPNEYIQEIFNTPVTFPNEIAFYKTIVPVLQSFQKEHRVESTIDFAPKYYGSRLNLNYDNAKVDSDGALILENLKFENYTLLERMDGLDLDAAKLVITNLAHLHAVPLALKLQKPEVFKNEIKRYLELWQLQKEAHDNIAKDIKRLIDETDELKPLEERILAGYDRMLEIHEPRELFATITHNDCWTNTNMFKLEDGKPTKSKMVDFQVCDYGSPAKDVVFLIFSSVKEELIQKYYEDFLVLYHQTFISVLKELNCDTKEFTFEAFKEEIDFEAKYSQFGHVAFMLFGIYLPKEHVKEVSELTPENMVMQISEVLKKKYVFFCNEFARRNWI